MKLHLTTIMLFLSFAVAAQTYVDIPWREGTVTIKGEEQEGMIRLGGDLGAPWLNYSKVYFLKKADYREGKRQKKKLIKKYVANDIEGYSTYTETKEGERIEMNFKTFPIMFNNGFKKKEKNFMLKLEETGAVNIYSHMSDAEYKSAEEAYFNSKIYLQKGDAKIAAATDCELVTLLEECPEVVGKIENEEYKFKPKSKRKKKKGFKGLKGIMKTAMAGSLDHRIQRAVHDYNLCVK